EVGVDRRAAREAAVVPGALAELVQVLLVGIDVVRAGRVGETRSGGERPPGSGGDARDGESDDGDYPREPEQAGASGDDGCEGGGAGHGGGTARANALPPPNRAEWSVSSTPRAA